MTLTTPVGSPYPPHLVLYPVALTQSAIKPRSAPLKVDRDMRGGRGGR
jgi:hypothetical protein